MLLLTRADAPERKFLLRVRSYAFHCVDDGEEPTSLSQVAGSSMSVPTVSTGEVYGSASTMM
jgi:hypothetical protein